MRSAEVHHDAHGTRKSCGRIRTTSSRARSPFLKPSYAGRRLRSRWESAAFYEDEEGPCRDSMSWARGVNVRSAVLIAESDLVKRVLPRWTLARPRQGSNMMIRSLARPAARPWSDFLHGDAARCRPQAAGAGHHPGSPFPLVPLQVLPRDDGPPFSVPPPPHTRQPPEGKPAPPPAFFPNPHQIRIFPPAHPFPFPFSSRLVPPPPLPIPIPHPPRQGRSAPRLP